MQQNINAPQFPQNVVNPLEVKTPISVPNGFFNPVPQNAFNPQPESKSPLNIPISVINPGTQEVLYTDVINGPYLLFTIDKDDYYPMLQEHLKQKANAVDRLIKKRQELLNGYNPYQQVVLWKTLDAIVRCSDDEKKLIPDIDKVLETLRALDSEINKLVPLPQVVGIKRHLRLGGCSKDMKVELVFFDAVCEIEVKVRTLNCDLMRH